MLNAPIIYKLSSLIYYSLFILLLSIFFNSGLLIAADQVEKDKQEKVGKMDKTGKTDKKKNQDYIKKKELESNDTHIEGSMANIQLIQQTLHSLRAEMESSKESSNLNRDSVKTMNDGLKLIDEKLKEAYTDLDKSHSNISSNTEMISNVGKEILEKSREIRANAADLISQNSLIEDNSIRLYEMLIKISDVHEKIETLAESMESIKSTSYIEKIKVDVANDINRLWQFFILIMVYFAPLAFVVSNIYNKEEDLLKQSKHSQGILLTVVTVFLAYFIIGFGIMYGNTSSAWVGTSSYLMEINNSDSKLQTNFPIIEFILYQVSFVIFAALIVYMSIGQKISNTLNIVIAFFIAVALIPIFGHWAWSGNFINDNQGWLQNLGFVDQSGSIVINAIAAWFTFIIAWKLAGSDSDSIEKSNTNELTTPVYSIASVLLLWLSWFGFTTGTLSITNENISIVMLNVSLAGSVGGLAAFLHYSFFHQDDNNIDRGLAGFIAGLVAIAACARIVTFMEAMLIGIAAGLLQNIAYSFLRKVFLKKNWQKRAASLVAIHGVAGIWGALCLALFGSDGNFSYLNTIQLVIQLQGIAAAIIYSFIMGSIMFLILNFFKSRSKTVS